MRPDIRVNPFRVLVGTTEDPKDAERLLPVIARAYEAEQGTGAAILRRFLGGAYFVVDAHITPGVQTGGTALPTRDFRKGVGEALHAHGEKVER